jgi:hypothetical protein
MKENLELRNIKWGFLCICRCSFYSVQLLCCVLEHRDSHNRVLLDPPEYYRLLTFCPQAKHTWQVLLFTGQCWLYLKLGGSYFAYAGSFFHKRVEMPWFPLPIRFLTKKSQKFQWVYLAPQDNNRISLFRMARWSRSKKSFINICRCVNWYVWLLSIQSLVDMLYIYMCCSSQQWQTSQPSYIYHRSFLLLWCLHFRMYTFLLTFHIIAIISSSF